MKRNRSTVIGLACAGFFAITLFSAPAAAPKPTAATQDRIVYEQNYTQKIGKNTYIVYQLFTMNSDGTGQTQITSWQTHGKMLKWPTWMPDGRIVYSAAADIANNDADPSPAALWIMNADGSNPVQVPGTATALGTFVSQSCVSPDGQFIAYSVRDTYSTGAVRVVAAMGGTPVEVVTGTSGHRVIAESWSPDLDPVTPGYQGKLLIGQYNDDPWTVKALTVQISLDGTFSCSPAEDPVPLVTGSYVAEWSPDGAYLCYQVYDAGTRLYQYRLLNLSTGTDTALTGFDRFLAPPRWSPDSDAVVFTKHYPKQGRIPESDEVCKVYLSAPGTIVRLTTTLNWEGVPAWSKRVFNLP